MGSRNRGRIKGFLLCVAFLGALWAASAAASGPSPAEERSGFLAAEIRALDTTFRLVLDRLDRSALQSEELSREVQLLKSERAAGVFHQVRLEVLLSRLREILLDRRELKKVEQNLYVEREKKAALLYALMGEEIDDLIREAEGAMRRGDARKTEENHRAVLQKMQTREALRRPRSLHIPALPEIEVPDLEGASPVQIKEVAVLLRNDAETLDKKRNEMKEEGRLLQEDIGIKRTLARLQGFPRGIEKKPIDLQIRELEERLAALNQAIGRYAERAEALYEMADRMLAVSKRQEERFR